MPAWGVRAARALADLLWPRSCAVKDCANHALRPGRHVCPDCFAQFSFLNPLGGCAICGAPVTARLRHEFRCENCAGNPPAYALLRSAVRYAAPASVLIQDFKYRRATWLKDDLADLLEGAALSIPGRAAVDAVIPVPLHPNRRRARGYNQSAVLARELARRLNRRFDETALVRTIDTPKQSKLDSAARRENMRGAFAAAAPQWIRGRTLLLVDDVTTTGSTLHECARTLRAAGAAAVWAVTAARRIREGLAEA